MLGGRLRQASEDRLVLPIGPGVIVLVSMSTSSQRTSMRKSRSCTFLHFPVLGAELSVLTHFKPQVDRFVFPGCHLVVVLASSRLQNSGLMLCSFTVQVQAQFDSLWNLTRTRRARRESGDIAPSFPRCGAHRHYSGTRRFHRFQCWRHFQG